MIDTDDRLGLLNDAKKDRERVLDDPPHRLGTINTHGSIVLFTCTE
jgi:hypothetical protein